MRGFSCRGARVATHGTCRQAGQADIRVAGSADERTSALPPAGHAFHLGVVRPTAASPCRNGSPSAPARRIQGTLCHRVRVTTGSTSLSRQGARRRHSSNRGPQPPRRAATAQARLVPSRAAASRSAAGRAAAGRAAVQSAVGRAGHPSQCRRRRLRRTVAQLLDHFASGPAATRPRPSRLRPVRRPVRRPVHRPVRGLVCRRSLAARVGGRTGADLAVPRRRLGRGRAADPVEERAGVAVGRVAQGRAAGRGVCAGEDVVEVVVGGVGAEDGCARGAPRRGARERSGLPLDVRAHTRDCKSRDGKSRGITSHLKEVTWHQVTWQARALENGRGRGRHTHRNGHMARVTTYWSITVEVIAGRQDGR